jgi:hypothetical protein
MTAAERQRKHREALAAPAPMTKSEREDLQRLIGQREKVLKQVAAARSAELLADFERQMASIYSYDQDEVWKAATMKAKAVVEEAQQEIAKRCEELGIPGNYAPSVSFSWHGRGENALGERQAELRRVAKSRIAAIEKAALVQTAQEAVMARTEIVASGLMSDGAKRFLGELAPLERPMPPIAITDVQALLASEPESPEARRRRLYSGY